MKIEFQKTENTIDQLEKVIVAVGADGVCHVLDYEALCHKKELARPYNKESNETFLKKGRYNAD